MTNTADPDCWERGSNVKINEDTTGDTKERLRVNVRSDVPKKEEKQAVAEIGSSAG